MKRETFEKLAVTLVLVAYYLWMPQIGYRPSDEGLSHILYIFSHANAWHLAGNLLVLWMIRGKLHLAPSFFIAYLLSYAPVAGSIWSRFAFDGVTMGFSGMLFAMVGIKWGLHIYRLYDDEQRVKCAKTFLVKVFPFALAGILIPHINWCIHAYCLMAGFIYGRCRR